jgi:hypothetical protein
VNLETMSATRLRLLVEREFALRLDEAVKQVLAQIPEDQKPPSMTNIAVEVSHVMNQQALEDFPGRWVPMVTVDESRRSEVAVVISIGFVMKLGAGLN